MERKKDAFEIYSDFMNELYEERREEFFEKLRKERVGIYGTETSEAALSALSLLLKIIVIVLVIGGIGFFLLYLNFKTPTSKANDKVQGVHATYVTDGNLFLYPFPEWKDNAIGNIKEGIQPDSIRWFLKNVNYERAERKAYGKKIMVHLFNIPTRWVRVYNGKKFKGNAWFWAHQFDEYKLAEDNITKKPATNSYRTLY